MEHAAWVLLESEIGLDKRSKNKQIRLLLSRLELLRSI